MNLSDIIKKLPDTIETERLLLKKHTLNEKYIQLWVDSVNANLPWLSKFISHFEEPTTFAKQKASIEKKLNSDKEINYAIWNKETNELMGSIVAHNYDEKANPESVELGGMLFKKFAGFGYGPEANSALVDLLFQQGIKNARANIEPENTRSRRSAEKAGYTWDGKEIGYSYNHPDVPMLVYRKFSKLHSK